MAMCSRSRSFEPPRVIIRLGELHPMIQAFDLADFDHGPDLLLKYLKDGSIPSPAGPAAAFLKKRKAAFLPRCEEMVVDLPAKVGAVVPTLAEDPEAGFDPDITAGSTQDGPFHPVRFGCGRGGCCPGGLEAHRRAWV